MCTPHSCVLSLHGLASGQTLIPFSRLQTRWAHRLTSLCSVKWNFGTMPVLWGKWGPKSVVHNIGKLDVGFGRNGWDLIDCLRTEIVPEHILSRRAK